MQCVDADVIRKRGLALKQKNSAQKKLRFHAVDWLLLLLLLAASAAVGYFFYSHYRQALPDEKIEYLLRVSAVQEELIQANGGLEAMLPIGSRVTSANGTAELGTVSRVQAFAHRVPAVSDGTVTFVSLPQYSDVWITVQGNGRVQNGEGIRIQDIRIAAGAKGDFRIGGYCAEATVLSVKRERTQ